MPEWKYNLGTASKAGIFRPLLQTWRGDCRKALRWSCGIPIGWKATPCWEGSRWILKNCSTSLWGPPPRAMPGSWTPTCPSMRSIRLEGRSRPSEAWESLPISRISALWVSCKNGGSVLKIFCRRHSKSPGRSSRWARRSARYQRWRV